MATDSCGQGKGYIDFDWARLVLFEALSEGAQGEYLCLSHGLFGCLAIAQGTRKLRNLGDPAAIKLFLALDTKVHEQSPLGDMRDCTCHGC